MASWETTRTRHGTASGWRLHKELNEKPCDACTRAKQAYDKKNRATPERLKRSRKQARAQSKAESDLVHRHYDEYRELYAKWLKKLEEEDG